MVVDNLASEVAGRRDFARSLGFELDPWQTELLSSDDSRVLLNCCRQSGKSTMAAIMALHKALSDPGSLTLCLAPSERQSKELFGKISTMFRSVHGVAPPESDRKLGMLLPSGSRIEALPGTERTIRGFSGVGLLIVDEASRVDDSLYFAVRPMLAVSGGSLLMLSTPYGRRGVFHSEWTEGEGWERYKVPATQCPRIPEGFIEHERSTMPEWWFAQEYLCKFRETEDQVFTYADVAAARDDEIEEFRFEGDGELWNTAS
jgi:Terminase large subunit, T4likevirus-type, N-terminal